MKRDGFGVTILRFMKCWSGVSGLLESVLFSVQARLEWKGVISMDSTRKTLLAHNLPIEWPKATQFVSVKLEIENLETKHRVWCLRATPS